MLKKILLAAVLLAALVLSMHAADLDETLQALSEDAARSYVNPMVSSFGSDMNCGWFHRVPEALPAAWSFELGVVVMGTLFIEDDKFFDVTGMFKFTRTQAEQLAEGFANEAFFIEMVNQIMMQEFELEISGPTITGPSYVELTQENGIRIYFDEQTITFNYNDQIMERQLPAQELLLEFGGLLSDYPALPLAAPQLSIGTFYGTQASFRFLPEVDNIGEIGTISYIGWGLQHNPAVWFSEPLPFDIALAYFTQKLEIGSLVEANASSYGINVAKTFGKKLIHVTPYMGFAVEQSKMRFRYDYMTNSTSLQVPDKIKIDFTADGKNKSKFTTGLTFRIALINVNFDVNFAKYPSASAGVMLNFSW